MKLPKVIAGSIFLFGICIHAVSQEAGSLDITFNPGAGANGLVSCLALQTNGQIICGGMFSTMGGFNRIYIARLNRDGSVDATFDPGQGPNGPPAVIGLQSDGSILLGGGFSMVNNIGRFGIARLRPDASLDTTYNPILANGAVTTWVMQGDQPIIIGGFTSVNGFKRNQMARLNQDGSLDLSFNPGAGITNGTMNALGLQSDGRVIVGGNFTAFSGVASPGLVRLNSNGSVDTNFNSGGSGLAGGIVNAITVLPGDKIVLAGDFTSINGYSRIGIARLNQDGSVDTSFRPGLGATPIATVVEQQDGKTVIGGNFSSFNGTSCFFLARLNTDGSLDTTFKVGSGGPSGFNYQIASLLLQPDGKLVTGGWFTLFNGTNINHIARLNSDSSSASLQFLNPNLYFGMNLQGTVSNTYRVEWTTNISSASLWNALFNVTLQTNPQLIFDPNPIEGPQRFYRAVALP